MADCNLLARSLAASLKQFAARLVAAEEPEDHAELEAAMLAVQRLALRYTAHCTDDNRLLDEIDGLLAEAETMPSHERRKQLADKALELADKIVTEKF